jgi:hypothetical protein
MDEERVARLLKENRMVLADIIEALRSGRLMAALATAERNHQSMLSLEDQLSKSITEVKEEKR